MSAPEISRRQLIRWIGKGAGLIAAGGVSLLRPETAGAAEYQFSVTPVTQIDFAERSVFTDFFSVDTPWANAGELQTYTTSTDNAYIDTEKGVLVIQAKKEGEIYTSGRLSSKGKLDFQYGKLQIEAKMPRDCFPALWLQTSAPTGGVVASNGEIDIVEAYRRHPGLVYANVHTRTSYLAGDQRNRQTINVPSMYDDFNTYEVQWTPNDMSFLVNGDKFHTVTANADGSNDWPFNQPDNMFHIITNVALEQGDIDDSEEPNWKMEVKSIRHYPLLTAV